MQGPRDTERAVDEKAERENVPKQERAEPCKGGYRLEEIKDSSRNLRKLFFLAGVSPPTALELSFHCFTLFRSARQAAHCWALRAMNPGALQMHTLKGILPREPYNFSWTLA